MPEHAPHQPKDVVPPTQEVSSKEVPAATGTPHRLLMLQRTAGNRAVNELVSRMRPRPAKRVQRQPNASTPTPAASPGAFKATVYMHEGIALAPDAAGCRAALERIAGEKGAGEAHDWAIRFINMDPATREFQGQAQGLTPEQIKETAVILKEELLRFDYDVKELISASEKKGIDIVQGLLGESEKAIKAERDRLNVNDAPSKANKAALKEMSAAARELAAARRDADKANVVAGKARADLDQKSRGDVFQVSLEPEKKKVEETMKAANDKEKAYADMAKAKTGQHPALAMYTTGGDAAERLEAFAKLPPEYQAVKLSVELDKKLQNINEVRDELKPGGRFTIWKQPTVLNMVKEQQASAPWQKRALDDHAKKLAADEASSKLMWSLLAIGLGLIAAIPTAGASLVVVAGVTAAAVASAGIAAYQTYQAVKEHQFQSALANTNMDKAKEISQEEPGLFWLALDIVGVIADVVAAGAAFKALRTAMSIVKTKGLTAMPALLAEAEKVGLTATAKGRLFAMAAEGAGGGGITSLEEVMKIFRQAVGTTKADAKLGKAYLKAAEAAKADNAVLLLERGKEMETLKKWIKTKDPSLSTFDVQMNANSILAALQKEPVHGAYMRQIDLIAVYNDDAAAVATTLAHELTHRQHEVLKVLEKLTKYETEVGAYAATRDFIHLLPPSARPKGNLWEKIAAMDDEAVRRYVKELYPDSATESEVGRQLADMIRGAKGGGK